MKQRKRFISILLLVCMIVSMLPVNAIAYAQDYDPVAGLADLGEFTPPEPADVALEPAVPEQEPAAEALPSEGETTQDGGGAEFCISDGGA